MRRLAGFHDAMWASFAYGLVGCLCSPGMRASCECRGGGLGSGRSHRLWNAVPCRAVPCRAVQCRAVPCAREREGLMRCNRCQSDFKTFPKTFQIASEPNALFVGKPFGFIRFLGLRPSFLLENICFYKVLGYPAFVFVGKPFVL